MNEERIKNRVKSDVKTVGVGKLEGFEIIFNKPSSDKKKARANIKENPHKIVYGVVYELTEGQLNKLNTREPGYRREKRKIKIIKNDKEEEIEAEIYVAEITKEGLKPDEEYIRELIDGAKKHNLPQDYIMEILEKSYVEKKRM
jgi:gamma-glutamylcyclotransferase (GGCT)/AIG2-like uncharacterized protein YtfP